MENILVEEKSKMNVLISVALVEKAFPLMPGIKQVA